MSIIKAYLVTGILLAGMLVFVAVRLVILSQPEVEEISHSISPRGTWIAKVDQVVYGDHVFVNVPEYEVRISSTRRPNNYTTVYSTPDGGEQTLAVAWIQDDELQIKDSSMALGFAIERPHAQVRIEYVAE